MVVESTVLVECKRVAVVLAESLAGYETFWFAFVARQLFGFAGLVFPGYVLAVLDLYGCRAKAFVGNSNHDGRRLLGFLISRALKNIQVTTPKATSRSIAATGINQRFVVLGEDVGVVRSMQCSYLFCSLTFFSIEYQSTLRGTVLVEYPLP